MSENEERLQRDIEAGKISHHEENLEANAYRHVFRALEKKPTLTLPGSFSDKVIQKLESRDTSVFADYFWLGIGILLSVLALIVAIGMTGFKLNFGFLSAMSSYKGLLVFATVLMIALHFLDKKLLRSART
jgi:hypothetical protein